MALHHYADSREACVDPHTRSHTLDWARMSETEGFASQSTYVEMGTKMKKNSTRLKQKLTPLEPVVATKQAIVPRPSTQKLSKTDSVTSRTYGSSQKGPWSRPCVPMWAAPCSFGLPVERGVFAFALRPAPPWRILADKQWGTAQSVCVSPHPIPPSQSRTLAIKARSQDHPLKRPSD